MKPTSSSLLFERSFRPIRLVDLVAYTGASGEFNPVHHDRAAAARAGLDEVLVHGTYAAGLVSAAVAEHFGADAVEAISFRFRAPLFLGDAPHLSVWEENEGNIHIELAVGEKAVLSAVAELAKEE